MVIYSITYRPVILENQQLLHLHITNTWGYTLIHFRCFNLTWTYLFSLHGICIHHIFISTWTRNYHKPHVLFHNLFVKMSINSVNKYITPPPSIHKIPDCNAHIRRLDGEPTYQILPLNSNYDVLDHKIFRKEKKICFKIQLFYHT